MPKYVEKSSSRMDISLTSSCRATSGVTFFAVACTTSCLIIHLTCNRWFIQYGATAAVGKLFSDVGTPRVFC